MDTPQELANHKPLVIQTQGLSKTYKGTAALKSLDLRVPEQQSGTMAWIFSKPVTRSAFLLSKFACLQGNSQ